MLPQLPLHQANISEAEEQQYRLIPQVAKLTFRNTILATLGNPGPQIYQKASKINKQQLPARPPQSARRPGAVLLLMLIAFSSMFGSGLPNFAKLAFRNANFATWRMSECCWAQTYDPIRVKLLVSRIGAGRSCEILKHQLGSSNAIF